MAPPVSDEQLRGILRQGFKTSTQYAHGEAPKSLDDRLPVRVSNVEPSPAVVRACGAPPPPLPKSGVPPAACRGQYSTNTVQQHKARVFRGGDELLAGRSIGADHVASLPPPDVAKQLMMPQSSTLTSIGKGRLDDQVMEVYTEGKAKEREFAAQRDELLNKPLSTGLPVTAKSTDVHCELLSVARSAADQPITRFQKGPHLARSGLATLGRDISVTEVQQIVQSSPDATLAGSERSAPRLSASAASLMPNVLSGSKKHMPSKALSPRRPTALSPSATEWESTSHSHFAPFDLREVERSNDRLATQPVLHATYRASGLPDVASGRQPHDSYSTTYETTIDRTCREVRGSPVTLDRSHHMPGSFNLVNGVRLISPQKHHPAAARKGTVRHVPSVTEIVPNHFATTNQCMPGPTNLVASLKGLNR